LVFPVVGPTALVILVDGTGIVFEGNKPGGGVVAVEAASVPAAYVPTAD